MIRRRTILAVILLSAGAGAQPGTDSDLYRIRQEAFERSQVMDHLFWLTDVYGPRLTGSPALKQAAEWAVNRFREFGVDSARLEPWEGFGRGWWCRNFEAHLTKPRYASLIGFALPWSPGTGGTVTGVPIPAVIGSEAELAKFQGKLDGAIVMLDPARELGMLTEMQPQRFTRESLERERLVPETLTPFEFLPRSPDRVRSRAAARAWRDKLHRFLRAEGVRLVIRQSRGGQYGNTYGGGAGSPDAATVDPPPTIVLAAEHYNRLLRLIENHVRAEISVDVQAGFETVTDSSFNVIAEIPGSAKRDEVVMLGAHLDSWTGGTGATDNAAGCAVMMEAMRVLRAVGIKPARTVRVALWSGEEQGILGSQAWVKAHAAEQARISVYFNHDYGAGRIRGVYLQNNDAARPVLSDWLRPLEDLGASTLTIRNGGGTDHLAFDAAGIPAFQFIQDPLEYGWRTHHHSMDVYERVPAADAMQSAAVLASLAYQAANAPGMMPRKPLPEAGR